MTLTISGRHCEERQRVDRRARSAGRSITAAIADVVLGRPRGADRSEVVWSAAPNEGDDRGHATNDRAAKNPKNH
jgi:hypothetical protein